MAAHSTKKTAATNCPASLQVLDLEGNGEWQGASFGAVNAKMLLLLVSARKRRLGAFELVYRLLNVGLESCELLPRLL